MRAFFFLLFFSAVRVLFTGTNAAVDVLLLNTSTELEHARPTYHAVGKGYQYYQPLDRSNSQLTIGDDPCQ